MQSRLQSPPRKAPVTARQQLRFAPIMHLESGDSVATLAEAPMGYSETAAFGPAAVLNTTRTNPAKWLAEQIEDIAAAAKLLDVTGRPILIPAPISAFAHSSTADACEAAVLE